MSRSSYGTRALAGMMEANKPRIRVREFKSGTREGSRNCISMLQNYTRKSVYSVEDYANPNLNGYNSISDLASGID